MMNPQVVEPEVLTEVPETLKRLVRYIVRGFYDIEHALIIDLLVHHPCIREEDLMDLLKFEQKQLRTAMNTLRNDKFVKVRMRMETNAEGRTSKQNYYFINYSTFVNVVKYKLDHIRRKIEMEERNMTSRASFKCPGCEKTFTDLEAGQLIDPYSGEMKCTFCHTEVEEDASAQPKTDARTLMVKFNEQIEPIFALLREVEDVKLSQEILEPEPVDLGKKHGGGSTARQQKGGWSGDRRTDTFNYMDSGVTVNIENDQERSITVPTAPVKEQPIWMRQSTVKGAEEEDMIMGVSEDGEKTTRTQESDDIMKTLLAHEKKTAVPIIPGMQMPVSDESSTSDSEAENSKGPSAVAYPGESQNVESEEEEQEVPMVMVAGQPVPYDEVDEEMTQKMTPAERDAYIKIGQEMYENMYD